MLIKKISKKIYLIACKNSKYNYKLNFLFFWLSIKINTTSILNLKTVDISGAGFKDGLYFPF